MNGNPIYSLFIEAMDTADRLPLDPRASLEDATERARAIIDLPDWLPAFESLINAMSDGRPLARRKHYEHRR
ncbi:MAG TPA: hypothetical protein PLU26_15990 [Candidatus Competibacter sp.]|nr:hypothetical protein [Candidatus Competibacter sp.]